MPTSELSQKKSVGLLSNQLCLQEGTRPGGLHKNLCPQARKFLHKDFVSIYTYSKHEPHEIRIWIKVKHTLHLNIRHIEVRIVLQHSVHRSKRTMKPAAISYVEIQVLRTCLLRLKES